MPPQPQELRSERIRQLGDRAQELQKLTEHPAWQVLQGEWKSARLQYIDRIARRLSSGGPQAEPLNQREIDYRRGWLDGVSHLLASPERAARDLNRALERTHDRD